MKILVEHITLIPSVKVGVLNALKPLKEDDLCEVKFKETASIKKIDIAWCDILVSVRSSENIALSIVEAAKKAGRYIIYFLDDDLLNVPINTPSYTYHENENLKSNLKKIIELSDVLWVVNSFLGENYSQYFNGKCVISKVPAEVERKFTNKESDIINILYAGSIDHQNTVQKYISPVVSKLMDEFPEKICFTFIGVDPNIKNNKRITYIKYIENFDRYREIVTTGGYCIGIAPIHLTNFHQSKYYNKFIEYTSINALGIYTNSAPYTLIVNDKKNGILVENTFEGWYEGIKIAICDETLRNLCIDNATELLINEFNPNKVAKKLSEDIPELISYYAIKIDTKKVEFKTIKERIYFYKEKIKIQFKKHGVLAVSVIIYKTIKIIERKIEGLKRVMFNYFKGI